MLSEVYGGVAFMRKRGRRKPPYGVLARARYNNNHVIGYHPWHHIILHTKRALAFSIYAICPDRALPVTAGRAQDSCRRPACLDHTKERMTPSFA